MPAGRPLKFATPEALEQAIEEYFRECDIGEDVNIINKRGESVNLHRVIPYSMEGLAVKLDVDPSSLRKYAKRDAFFPVISRARNRVQASWVKGGLNGDYNPKVVTFCMPVLDRDYIPQQNHEHIVGTLEDKLRSLREGRQEQLPDPNVIDVTPNQRNDDNDE